jgi:hypothetical protein
VLGLPVCIVLVAALNVWAFGSESEFAGGYRGVALILGLLCVLGVPLGLFRHGKSFVSIRWGTSGFVMSHYLTPWHPAETASWDEIRRVAVEVGANGFDDAGSAVAALREGLKRSRFVPSFVVQIAFFCRDGRKIHVLPTMLTPRQVLPFLSAAAHYLSGPQCEQGVVEPPDAPAQNG